VEVQVEVPADLVGEDREIPEIAVVDIEDKYCKPNKFTNYEKTIYCNPDKRYKLVASTKCERRRCVKIFFLDTNGYIQI